MQQLRRALDRHPNDPAIQYDLGTLAHRRGDYPTAATALNQALATAREPLQGRIAYNLGNTQYRQAQAKERTAPTEAATCYRQALDNYRLAIREYPHDRDAQYNYELTERRLKQLKEQSAKKQQQQPATSSQQPAQSQMQSGQNQQAQQQQGARSKEQGASKEQPAAGNQQAQAEQQRQQPATSDQQPAQSAGAAQAPDKQLSQQEAFWILDTLQQDERGAPLPRQQSAHESPVDQDW